MKPKQTSDGMFSCQSVRYKTGVGFGITPNKTLAHVLTYSSMPSAPHRS